MSKIDPNDLERLMTEAGVGRRTAKKLREANEPKDKVRGHGAPSENRVSFDLDEL